jgi:eukaryotic-like serine/threonine-protein kinase
MGAVYLARHAESGEQVALKVMLPQIAADEQATARFLRESENTMALRHPHVVEFRDAGCSQGTFYFTVEYCDYGSAEDLRQRRGGALGLEEASAIVIQALHGLEYAHQASIPQVRLADGSYAPGRGVVHRDLSPDNILFSGADGGVVAKLSDFGLGKAFDLAGLSGLTRSGEAAGKPWFMPRQQITNFLEAKPEVDVWAAAACLYVFLTGRFPRDFPPRKDVWRIVLESDAVPIRRRERAIPKRLAKVIDTALVDRPRIEIRTAAELRRALEDAL